MTEINVNGLRGGDTIIGVKGRLSEGSKITFLADPSVMIVTPSQRANRDFIESTIHFQNSGKDFDDYMRHESNRPKWNFHSAEISIIEHGKKLLEKVGYTKMKTMDEIIQEMRVMKNIKKTNLFDIYNWVLYEEDSRTSKTYWDPMRHEVVELPKERKFLTFYEKDAETFFVSTSKGSRETINKTLGRYNIQRLITCPVAFAHDIFHYCYENRSVMFDTGANIQETVDVVCFTFLTMLYDIGEYNRSVERKISGVEDAYMHLLHVVLKHSVFKRAKDVEFIVGIIFIASKGGWFPSEEILDRTIACIKYSYGATKRYRKKRNPEKQDHVASDIFDAMGYDTAMLDAVIHYDFEKEDSDLEPMETAVIYSAITVESFPEMLFFVDTNDEDGMTIEEKRDLLCDTDDSTILKKIRKTQRYIYDTTIMSVKDQMPTSAIEGYMSEIISIDHDILEGIFGSVEVMHSRKSFIISPIFGDEMDFHVIRKPTANLEDVSVNEDEREAVIQTFIDMMEAGISVTPPDSFKWTDITKYSYANNTLFINDMVSPKMIYEKQVNYFQYNIEKFNLGYLMENNRRAWNSPQILILNKTQRRELEKEIKSCITSEVYNRLRYYLTIMTNKIEIVGMKGSAQGFQPIDEDLTVFRILVYFAAAYPCYLKQNYNEFIVNNSIRIREKFTKYMDQCELDRFTLRVKKDSKKPYQYQRDAILYLQTRYEKNRNCIIWANTGTGKTLMIARFLYAERDNLPEYIVYIYPKSSAKTVKKEFENHSVKCHDLTFKTEGGELCHTGIKKNCINFVEQDQLAKGLLYLLDYSMRTLVVLDEMHGCLDETNRTSAALQYMSTCAFFVGMTGTLIKDKTLTKVYPYLSSLVDYEVSEKNYVTAFTNVFILRTPIDIPNDWYKVPISDGESVLDTLVTYARNAFVMGRRPVIVVDTKKDAEDAIRKLEATGAIKSVLHIHSKNQVNKLYGEKCEDVAVIERRMSAGYNLTSYNTMIMGVYQMNIAILSQLMGRIRRIGQLDAIEYYTIVSPAMEHTYDAQVKAMNISECLKSNQLNIVGFEK